MEIVYLPKFARQFKKLPRDVQDAALEREQWFRTNPYDSRLHTHKLSGILEGRWAFSVTNRCRVIFKFMDEGLVKFYAIGNHDIYDA